MSTHETLFNPIEEDVLYDPLQEYIDQQFYLCTLFEDKGYRAVNISFVNTAPRTAIGCLEMDESVVNRFVNNMKELGYTCTIYPAHKRRYRNVVINGVEHPFDIMYVFRHLKVIA